MKAVEILTEEHRLLFRVLACLERLLDEAAGSDRLDAEVAAEILDYLERYADGCHQDKEEEVLFPKLMESTPAEKGELVRELFDVHETERALLKGLRRELEVAAGGDARSRQRFVERASAYLALQRDHAEQEDELLLPLAKECLGRADDADMLVGFQEIEARHFGQERRDPGEIVDAICARFGVCDPVQPALDGGESATGGAPAATTTH